MTKHGLLAWRAHQYIRDSGTCHIPCPCKGGAEECPWSGEGGAWGGAEELCRHHSCVLVHVQEPNAALFESTFGTHRKSAVQIMSFRTQGRCQGHACALPRSRSKVWI